MNELCECHQKLVAKIKDFLINVKYVKEESITDYLMWQWKKIDKLSIKNKHAKNSFRKLGLAWL